MAAEALFLCVVVLHYSKNNGGSFFQSVHFPKLLFWLGSIMECGLVSENEESLWNTLRNKVVLDLPRICLFLVLAVCVGGAGCTVKY